MIYLIYLLQIIDLGTTVYLLKKHPDAFEEGNPALRKLFEKVGVMTGLLMIKLPLVAAIVAADYFQLLHNIGIAFIIVYYVFIAINNIKRVRRAFDFT